MTWRAVRAHTHFNSWAISFLWVVLLLDCIVVHGCLRDEQQSAIKVSKKVTLEIKSLEDKYDIEIPDLQNELHNHKRSIHYGRVKE